MFPPRPNSYFHRILTRQMPCPKNISESNFLKLRKKALIAGVFDKLDLPSITSIRKQHRSASVTSKLARTSPPREHIVPPPQRVIDR